MYKKCINSIVFSGSLSISIDIINSIKKRLNLFGEFVNFNPGQKNTEKNRGANVYPAPPQNGAHGEGMRRTNRFSSGRGVYSRRTETLSIVVCD